jgi:sterol desaturase/sphingolipid hydroxylase (fatty acid hydroxylase superfamily)
MSTAVQNSLPAAELRRRQEARKARRRFYPSTVVYTVYALTVGYFALRSGRPMAAIAYFAGGIAVWTLIEYLFHRFVLHGRFPAGPGPLRWFAHAYLDPLHWEHHKRPWDGNHINGTLKDTLPVLVVFAAIGWLFPLPTGPMLVVGIVAGYVVEEWVHHSVHFYRFDNRYFQYIRRHHLYHHSPKGMEVAFGLSNGFWDIVWDTRIPEEERIALYHGKRRPHPAHEPERERAVADMMS